MTKRKDQWPAHALAKLASSGLTRAQAQALGITFLAAPQTKNLHPKFELVDALHLAYVDPWTNDGFHDLEGRPPFYRLRYLRQDSGSAFGEKDKRPRYTNEPGFMVHAYFPTVLEWPALLADSTQPLFLTEGELKAAKACCEGFPTIGLGGVDSFSSAVRGVRLLPELERVTWHKRRVYIVYDSDAEAKPDVRRAMNRLAKTLGQRGALTFQVKLPAAGDEKVGLDDYLVAHGRDAFEALLGEAFGQGPEPLAYNEPLFQLNDEVVYIASTGFFVHQATGVPMKKETFTLTYATLPKCRLKKETAKGPAWEEVPATRAWIEWPERTQAGMLVYEPQPYGKSFERLTPHADPMRSSWNVWPGWGVAPETRRHPDGVQWFLDVVDHVFTGAEPGVKEWFLRWLAFPLRYPGTKLFTAVILHGRGQGTGKSLMGHTMKRLYGKNYTEIGNEELSSSFNDWAARKQFILGDEITGSDKREFAERLKRLITQPEVRVNEKNLPAYLLADCTNFLFTSNHGNAFPLTDNDRRYFVHEVTAPPLEEDFFMPYYLWLEDGGAATIMDYLLELDLGDFNARTKAPMTLAKEAMIAGNRSELEDWALRLRDDPEVVLAGSAPYTIAGDLWTPGQLLEAFDPEGKSRARARALGLALNGIVPKANEGNQVRGPFGKQYYYVVRNRELWASANLEDIKTHLTDRTRGPGKTVLASAKRKLRKY